MLIFWFAGPKKVGDGWRYVRCLKSIGFECTHAHCRCVFELMNNNPCTQCVKFNLCCAFRVSGMFHILFCLVFPDQFSNNNQLISCCILHISEQGHWNDLNKLCFIPLSSNEQQVFPSPLDVSSDSVHSSERPNIDLAKLIFIRVRYKYADPINWIVSLLSIFKILNLFLCM